MKKKNKQIICCIITILLSIFFGLIIMLSTFIVDITNKIFNKMDVWVRG